MKIRQGFVSNSSSSSFIVGFDKVPRTVEETRKLLFGDDVTCETDYDTSAPTQQIADRVFSDVQALKPATDEVIFEAVSGGSYDGQPPYDFDAVKESSKIEEEFNTKYPNLKSYIYHSERIDDSEASALAKKYIDTQRAERDEAIRVWDESARKYIAESVTPLMKDKVVYVLNYGDENPGEDVMEHGGIFDNVAHIKISHH